MSLIDTCTQASLLTNIHTYIRTYTKKKNLFLKRNAYANIHEESVCITRLQRSFSLYVSVSVSPFFSCAPLILMQSFLSIACLFFRSFSCSAFFFLILTCFMSMGVLISFFLSSLFSLFPITYIDGDIRTERQNLSVKEKKNMYVCVPTQSYTTVDREPSKFLCVCFFFYFFLLLQGQNTEISDNRQLFYKV
ncbi:hypothetical protein I4U23_025359 [Adineta vaga]|nr:hypothetical protein I4U23_025359 [Adineta vaga]